MERGECRASQTSQTPSGNAGLQSHKPSTLKVGDVVIVCGDESNRGKWLLGVVADLFKGSDGVVRAAKLFLERLVQHLFPLELACDNRVQMQNTPDPNPEPRSSRSGWDTAVAADFAANEIVIQAVADELNLTIHIIESNPGFVSVTNISAVSSETDTTVIPVGHLGEVHYVWTIPFNEQAMAFNVICNNQPPQLATGCCKTTNNNETIAVAKEQKIMESLFKGIHGNKEKKWWVQN